MQTVLVADPLPAPAPGSLTNQNAGTVDFTSYAPKRIVLQAKADCPALLLLNDRFRPDWIKMLPQQSQMMGFGGRVEFRFAPPVDTFYVSLIAVGIGIMLLGVLVLSSRRR